MGVGERLRDYPSLLTHTHMSCPYSHSHPRDFSGAVYMSKGLIEHQKHYCSHIQDKTSSLLSGQNAFTFIASVALGRNFGGKEGRSASAGMDHLLG